MNTESTMNTDPLVATGIVSWIKEHGPLTVFLRNTESQTLTGHLIYLGANEYDTPRLDNFMILYNGSAITLMAFLCIFVGKYPEVVEQLSEYAHVKDIPPQWIRVYCPGFPTVGSLVGGGTPPIPPCSIQGGQEAECPSVDKIKLNFPPLPLISDLYTE
jgi:hypothetical protein